MSLLDALLLDSYRMNLWIACRTDRVGGSGTQSDPFDGSTQAKFDALMNAMPMLVSSLTYVGTTATVTAISHGYVTVGSPHAVVVIAGVTGASANLFNGSFTITYVDANAFTYTMSGTPSATRQVDQRWGSMSTRHWPSGSDRGLSRPTDMPTQLPPVGGSRDPA